MRNLLIAFIACITAAFARPRHLRMNLIRKEGSMRFAWNQLQTPQYPTLALGSSPTNMSQTIKAQCHTFSQGDLCGAPATDPENWVNPGFVCVATASGLPRDGKPMYYSVGDGIQAANKSDVFEFRPSPVDTTGTTARLLITADTGTTGHAVATLSNMSKAIERAENLSTSHGIVDTSSFDRPVDLVLFNGDLSYAMGKASKWDEFFSQMQGIAARVPVSFSVGNHEFDWTGQAWDPWWSDIWWDTGSQGECGLQYDARLQQEGPAPPGPRGNNWTAPGYYSNVNNYWYSVNRGPVHVIALSTEHNYTTGSPQRQWLEKDLAAVDRTPGRGGTPFVIVMLHRALYDTTLSALLPEEFALRYELEPVFERYNVSLVLLAHIHNYQRTCAVYDGNCTGSDGWAPGMQFRSSQSLSTPGAVPSMGLGEIEARRLALQGLEERRARAIETGHRGVRAVDGVSLDPTGGALERELRRAPGTRGVYGGDAGGSGSPPPRGRPYVVIGSGGKTSGTRFWVTDPEWLAFRSEEFGYLDLVVHNQSVATARYVSDPDGVVLDEFSFGPY